MPVLPAQLDKGMPDCKCFVVDTRVGVVRSGCMFSMAIDVGSQKKARYQMYEAILRPYDIRAASLLTWIADSIICMRIADHQQPMCLTVFGVSTKLWKGLCAIL